LSVSFIAKEETVINGFRWFRVLAVLAAVAFPGSASAQWAGLNAPEVMADLPGDILRLGDMNGDGRDDLIILRWEDFLVYVQEEDGGYTFSDKTFYGGSRTLRHVITGV